MSKYNIWFNRFGVDLLGNSYEELLQSFIAKNGGPENLLNIILRDIHIVKDNIKDIEIIEDGNITNMQETTD